VAERLVLAELAELAGALPRLSIWSSPASRPR
jgi:hypothetical protein